MVMDTLMRGHEEMHQRLVGLQNEKDKVSLCVYCHALLSSHLSSSFLCQLTSEYREKKKKVDKLKEELQVKINEYTKFAEQGEYQCAFY